MPVNQHDAQQHLTTLDPEENNFIFQTFPDIDVSDPKSLTRVLYGTLDAHWDELVNLNAQGAGVYVTVNAMAGKRRRKTDARRLRAFWVEDDGEALPLPLKPHLVIQTSPGKTHSYMLVDSDDVGRFDEVQRIFVDRYGSDPNAKDVSRVLRLAGTYNMKDPLEKHLVVIQSQVAVPRWDIDELVKTLGGLEPGNESIRKRVDAWDFSSPDLNGLSIWQRINTVALHNTSQWVPELFPDAKPHQDGYRISSDSLGRDLEEDISIVSEGARDFGEETPTTPLNLVERWGTPTTLEEAARWLCERLDTSFDQLKRDLVRQDFARVADCKTGRQLAVEMGTYLKARFSFKNWSAEECCIHFDIFPTIIESHVAHCIWAQEKFHVLTANGLNAFAQADIVGVWTKLYGPAFNHDAIRATVADTTTRNNPTAEQLDRDARKVVAALNGIVMLHAKMNNACSQIQWRHDIFLDESTINIDGSRDTATITEGFTPFFINPRDEGSVYVQDFKDHFERFDEFIEFLAMSKTASDRKQAYLWIHAPSDWGKGLLISVLKALNMGHEISVKQTEAMFEGRAVGLSPGDFRRRYAIIIDEFKTVKSELKQLQSMITLSPKYQLQTEVEVFAKLFFSAEDVGSLVTEHGVEDQFVKRMSYWAQSGVISERYLFKSDKERYMRALCHYVSTHMNEYMSRARRLGRDEAFRKADVWLREFQERHGIGNQFGNISHSFQAIADEFLVWIHNNDALTMVYDAVKIDDSGHTVLLKPATVFKKFLESEYDHNDSRTFKRRSVDILKLVTTEDEYTPGKNKHYVEGARVKCMRIPARVDKSRNDLDL